MTAPAPDSLDTETMAYLCTPYLDPLFWREGRDGVTSAWYGHIPFAHWIVAVLRPRIMVELGTQNGVSYSAFCEAVVRNGLDTRCFAVDTWRGDDQVGHYGEEVYLDLRHFHDGRYGAFSELLRCTFDEALPYIPEASVDLLHIDGLHTYEAVRHDLENWRPKLSDNAVVLFHDTNVREREFGVWRLWKELHTQFPSFEFLHGRGLGVLAVGRSTSPQVAVLCSLADSARVSAIRERFSLLGERWILLYQSEQLQEGIGARDTRIGSLEAEVAALYGRVGSLEAEILRLNSELAYAEAKQQEKEQLRAAEIAGRDAHIQTLETEIAELTRRTAVEEQLRIRAAHRAKEARAEALRAIAEVEQAASAGSPADSMEIPKKPSAGKDDED